MSAVCQKKQGEKKRRFEAPPLLFDLIKKGGIAEEIFEEMIDLFSRSLKKYYENFKHQIYVDDIEAGRGNRNDMTDLDRFFEDIEKVKNDITDVEKLYNKLQESNEESKVIHNAKTIKELRFRMDSDVAQVIKRVKVIKGKIEALDKSNVAHRDIPECGPGSSADRTRTCLVNGLRKKLKVMMDKFQALRAKMAAEYKETIERRYFAVTGEKANEDLIENLISSGESERFLLKAIQEQGPGQILDTISETQERYNAVKKIEKNLMELHQLFLDMAVLVDSQGQQLNNIEIHMAHAKSYVRRGTEQLQEAKVYQKSSRKWICFAIGLGTCVLILFLLPVLARVL